ncbi:urea amidolyase associated protein UAAP1 [Derxia gummosa]|uniref:Urea amidolyase associated protein UAAP1 n=1 Tax=Derxia gummosa DSM 723 TaxID=1121388 RepID=A0A8B6X3X1_9BURK|nr:urea amidolyase associated protein UAAP1 [Derxia gummosa]
MSLPPIKPELLLWTEEIPGGTHWSGVVRRGTTLRFTDLEGRANVALILFNAEEKLERYNMPDTLKTQHIAHLTAGHALHSDMGRVMASIPADSLGWHDPIVGPIDDATVAKKYGTCTYQEARNGMFRSARTGLLIELGKVGLGKKDLGPTLNLFSKVLADDAGALHFDAAHRKAGARIDLRMEMTCLVALSAAPHALDPSPVYAPGPVRIECWRSGTAGPDDRCRLSRPENARGFTNTERYYAC